jgi:hypothetical protein
MPAAKALIQGSGRNLVSVATLAKQYDGFTESQIRAWVHNRDKNGLAECVVKPNQRRLYIDVDRFEEWLEKRTRELAPRT